jgi:hypothetical protein
VQQVVFISVSCHIPELPHLPLSLLSLDKRKRATSAKNKTTAPHFIFVVVGIHRAKTSLLQYYWMTHPITTTPKTT